jgi:hypothetical protein
LRLLDLRDDAIVVVPQMGAAVETVPLDLPDRVEKMDKDLKEYFADQQSFISHALSSAEKRTDARFVRLETRFDGLETKFDEREKKAAKFERDVRLSFQVVNARLRGIEGRMEVGFAEIRRDMKGMAADLKRVIRTLRRTEPGRRRRS